LELPDIIKDIVDLLMPEITPYEVAIYLYLLRHSIIEKGTQYIRASTRGLQSGVVKSAYAGRGKDPDSAAASLQKVRLTLAALVEIGAVRQEGEANREGTLYRVLLPEEIPVCIKRRQERTRQTAIVPATEAEADFYNVRENRIKIYERDNYTCGHCGKQLTRFTATLDHVQPVAEGGDNSASNLLTSCLQCNSRKTSRPLGDFMADANPTA
jgi:hypothetical protein